MTGFTLLSRVGLCALLLFALTATGIWAATDTSSPAEAEDAAPGRQLARQAVKDKELWITADHSKHEALKKQFDKPEQVTAACLGCHTEAAAQFHKTIHWTWLDPNNPKEEQIGKGGLVINNF